MKTYYTKDGFIFSDTETEIEIPISFNAFCEEKINEENSLKSLQNYLEKGWKKYTIYGHIPNFENIEPSLKKGKKEKPKEDDYSFVEITSQPLVLKQLKELVEQNRSEFPPQTILKALTTLEKEQSKRKKTLEEEKNKLEEKYSKQKKQYDELLDSEIKQKKNRNQEIEKEIETLKEKQHEYQKLLDNKTNEHKTSTTLMSLQKEIEQHKFDIEKNQFDIHLLKAKVKTLENEKKLGKKHKVSIILFIITLGLIYWTRFANINHHIKSYKISILKKEESIVNSKKKLFLAEHKKEQIEKQQQEHSKENIKKQESLYQKIEELENKQEEYDKELKKNEKLLEKAEQKLEPVKEKLNDTENKLEKINKELETLENSSKEKGHELLKKIEEKIDSTLSEIKKLQKDFEKQKIPFKEEAIIKL